MNQNHLPTPPVARQEHIETPLHGTVLVDDYAWLRDKENPETTAYLNAENAYAEAVLAPLKELREQLYQEMLSHIKQTDISVPFRDGDWWYYTRTEEGLQYAIHCRKRGGAAGPDNDAPGTCDSGWQRNGKGACLLLHRLNRYYRRRALACVHHRHYRLPPVHAAHQGS